MSREDLVKRFKKAVDSFPYPDKRKTAYLDSLGVKIGRVNSAIKNKRLPKTTTIIALEPVIGKELCVEAVFYRTKRNMDEESDSEYTAANAYLRKNAPETFRAYREAMRQRTQLKAFQLDKLGGKTLEKQKKAKIYQYYLDGRLIHEGTVREIAAKSGYSESYVESWRFNSKHNKKKGRKLVRVEI